ncbi:unnamed protein product [Phaedon cochleariae]|uniref:Alpha-1,6-mannosyl-glycoprotein 2-beta-N-acetylglucosaminyltransferase n=1 Tax=Phaedon cochleariae TaxID=80249 RepID=A0A9N9SCE4_PHACE|nr:unnamed protein product [Phaedon cochleariae]
MLHRGLVILILVFMYFQLNLLLSFSRSFENLDINDSDEAILSMIPAELHKFLSLKPTNSTQTHSNGSDDKIFHISTLNISYIKDRIAQYNLQQRVLNENSFQSLENNSIVIVVQIHDRINYLRYLIVSLAQAPGISHTLLIFSHDYYDEQMNSLVQSIDFCKVIQIFYPYSIQAHPKEFPGEDPKDCPRDMKKEHAVQKKCNNALSPDVHGHYREAKFTQTKHHWWWKANRVFKQLEVTRNHRGLIVMLEEDHYVGRDFIHTLRLMEKTSKESCSHCNVFSLGTYMKTYNYYANSKKVEISPWIGGKHNMGMAFNRSTWMQIVDCATFFCGYDDYNWDWSLQQVSEKCLKQKLHAMVAVAPRVFHIGECGFHHRKNNCRSNSVISRVQQVLKLSRRYFYPDRLILTYSTVPKKTEPSKGNGGWGDKRDHKLCMGMTVG